MNSKRHIKRSLVAVAAMALAAVAPAYVFFLDESGAVSTWRPGTIPMQVKLSTSPTLTDGSTQSSSVLAAMGEWNVFLGTVQFSGQALAPGSYGIGNGVNEIVMDSAIGSGTERHDFAANVLAVTVFFESGNFYTEADIVFNTAYQWDSFRGGQPSSAHDIRRVAAHELGHVLGLDHPDEASPPQYVTALMDSTVSYWPSIETMQEDDITGAQELYGYPGFTPANDNFSNATVVTIMGTMSQLNGTNVAATKEPGEPNLDPDDPGGRTVWWKLTASATGLLTVTTLGSNFDTLLGAYTGTAVDSLTQLALNDDVESGVIRSSTITISIENGGTYYFAVDGWGGTVGRIQINFAVAQDPTKPLPSFSIRPLSRNAIVGQPVTFTAQASSPSPVTYKWRHNRQDLEGQTGSELHLPSASIEDSGLYEVVASNENGSVSSILYLRVTPADLDVVAWGYGDSGQATVPAGIGNVFSAAAGMSHNLALRTDGTVAGWGNNSGSRSTPPAGLTGVVAVAAGIGHSLALRSDGTVTGWGDNNSPPFTLAPPTESPAGLADVIAISAGEWNNLALRADGTVVSWGKLYGTPMPAGLGGIVAIASGPSYSLALRYDGTLVEWGLGYEGEVKIPVGLSNVVAIAAGGSSAGSHSLALKSNGTVVAWGSNTWGQCNVPAGLSGVIAITAGSRHSLALKSNGVVIGWGEGSYGQLNMPTDFARVFEIHGGYLHSIAVVQKKAPTISSQPVGLTVNLDDAVHFGVVVSGTAPLSYQWKRNGVSLADGNGITGANSPDLRIEQAGPSHAGDYTVTITNAVGSVTSATATLVVATPPILTLRPQSAAIVEGDPIMFSVAAEGSGPFAYQWRHNRQTIAGATTSSFELGSATRGDSGYYEAVVTNAAGGSSISVFYLSVAVESSTILTWGDGASAPPSIDVPVSAVAVGGASLALKGDGKVVAWGTNNLGQANVPASLGGVVAIAASTSHSLALKSNGTVTGWGSNQFGRATPPQGLTGVVAIAAGQAHSIALKSDGTVVTWGDPRGAYPYGPEVVTPPRLRNVVAVAAADYGYLAVLSDGTVQAWGSPLFNGQPPAGLSDVVSLSSNGFLHLALKANGKVVAWGYSNTGSTTVPQNLENATSIASGVTHGLAVVANGGIVAWGRNQEHQTPGPAGVSTAVAVAAAQNSSLALIRTVAPAITTSPSDLVATVGDYVTLTAGASGSNPLDFQWTLNGVPLVDGDGVSGALTATLVLDPVKASDGGTYRVVVSNNGGDAISDPTQLAVKVPPEFIKRPLSRTIGRGGSVTFDGTATGVGPITYEWRHNGVVLNGETGPTLTLTDLGFADGGFYEVIASNAVAANWSTFRLTVSPMAADTLVVDAWGTFGQAGTGPTSIPSDLGQVVAVAAGHEHAIALRADGMVRVWGVDTVSFPDVELVPAGLAEVVDIAAGYRQMLALRADGRVAHWRVQLAGQPDVPEGLRRIVAVASHAYRQLALRSDGTVVAWGLSPPPAGLSNVISIAVNDTGGLALRSDGTVVQWDRNTGAPLVVPPGLSGVIAIAAGEYHTLALKADGTVVGWGSNVHGESSAPAGLGGVVAISAGTWSSVVLKADGTVLGWGANNYGQVESRPDFAPVAALSSGSFYNLVLTSNLIAPSFVTQPEGRIVPVGSGVLLGVQATGRPTPLLQWQKDGVDIPGATRSSLQLTDLQVADSGAYRVVATNAKGTATSDAANVDVRLRVQQPVFSPPSGALVSGESVAISTPTEGATIRYTLDGTVPSSTNGAVYSGPVVISQATTLWALASKDGMIDSPPVSASYSIIVNSVPRITRTSVPGSIVGVEYHEILTATGGNGGLVWTVASGSLPQGINLLPSGELSGAGTASGTSTFTVRVADSDAVEGPSDEDTIAYSIKVDATNSVPTITTTTLPNAGVGVVYSAQLAASGGNGPPVWSLASGSLPAGLVLSPDGVISGITHSLGTRTFTVRVADSDTIKGASDETTKELALTVVAAPRLINVSTRTFAGSGNKTLVMGFYISGTGAKTLLIRGIGPRLTFYDVPSVVADPEIQIYQGATLIGGNDDWDPSLAPDFVSVGAFALEPGSKDAAMKVTLPPGGYTVHLVNNGPVAEALVEVYDISRDAGSRLTNVSCRLSLNAGANVIIGTALIGGSVPVLVRNVGPALAHYGIPENEVLPDPHLRVYSGSTEIAVNEDWDSAVGEFFGPVGAFPLTASSKDAAIRVPFSTGGFTVHATGNGGSGIAIVELYESP